MIYPHCVGTMFTVGVYAAFALGTGASLIWLKDDLSLWQTLVLFGTAALFAYVFFRAVGQLGSPKPLLRFDEKTMEGSFGRINWDDVERISIEYRWFDSTRVVSIHLKSGTRDPDAAYGEYASSWVFGGSLVTSERLEIPVWGYKKKMVHDLRSFYGGPIGAK